MNAITARTAVQGVVDFLRQGGDLTETERQALAALDRDEEAAIERGVAVLAEPTEESAPQREGRVETFVVFTREQLRHAGAHHLARQTNTPNVTTIDWADWGKRRAS